MALNKGKDNLPERKYTKKLIEKTDKNDKHFVDNTKQTEMSASFARADHLEDENLFQIYKPLMYQLDLMQEEIDELRSFIGTELATTGSIEPVSSSFAALSSSFTSTSRGFANLPTSPVGLSTGDLYILNEKDKTKTIKMK